MSWGNFPEDVRLDMTTDIIRIIIKHSVPMTVRLAVEPTPLQQQDLSDHRMDRIVLAVAMYTQAVNEVRALLDDGADPWGQTVLFKDPIYIATELGNEEMVKAILLAIDKIEVGLVAKQHRQRQARVMTNAIQLAVRNGHWLIAERLMTWSTENNVKSPFSSVGSWVRKAVSSDKFDILEKMRTLGYLQYRIGMYAEFIVGGLLSNPKPEPALRFCIDHRLFDENKVVSGRYSTRWLLDIAIQWKNVPLVKAAIAVNSYADRSASLRSAIKQNSPSIVRALLDSGVDPEARMHPPVDQTTCELATGHTQIYNMLRKAIQRKRETLGADYHPPHQKLIAKNGGYDYVAYTFHAPKPKDQV